MAQSTLSVRVDEDVKRSFDSFCTEVGLNTSVAINMFMRAVLRERRIPFEVVSNRYSDPESIQAFMEALQLENDPTAKSFSSIEELLADLESDDDD